jgi:hypothetical protein
MTLLARNLFQSNAGSEVRVQGHGKHIRDRSPRTIKHILSMFRHLTMLILIRVSLASVFQKVAETRHFVLPLRTLFTQMHAKSDCYGRCRLA